MAVSGEIVRVALHYTQPNAGDCMNVFHFRLSGTVGDDADVLDGIVDGWLAYWHLLWKSIAASSAVLSHLDADVINIDGTVDRNLGSAIVNVAGTVGGEVTSAAVSGYLLAYTPIPKARGSKYIPGMSEVGVAAGAFTTGVQTVLTQLLILYASQYVGTGGLRLNPGVLSLVLAEFIDFLGTGLIETLPAYQRRRKAGVGI